MAKKSSGDGWSFRPADSAAEPLRTTRSAAPAEHRVTVVVEKRAKGKLVTVLGDLTLTEADLKKLAKTLKSACGTGGTARVDTIELQGDCRERVVAWLTSNGWGLR